MFRIIKASGTGRKWAGPEGRADSCIYGTDDWVANAIHCDEELRKNHLGAKSGGKR